MIWLVRRLIVLILMAGCGNEAKSPPPSSQPTPPAARDAGVAAGLPADADNGLMSPGAEPRQKLAYAFVKGAKVALAIETDLERTLPTGEGPLPTMKTEFETEVMDVAADGTGTLRSTVKKVGTVERAGATVDQSHVARQAALLEGAVITFKVAPDGTVTDSAITLSARDVTPEMTEEAKGALEPFTRMSKLPAEPVGVGAKWRRTSVERPGGVRIANRAEYEVTAIAGTKVTYRLTATFGGAEHQTVQGPGIAIDVTNIRGAGAGSGTFDLATATTIGEYSQKLELDMTAAGEKATAMLRSGYRAYGLQSAP
jgi:hypothetical protein